MVYESWLFDSVLEVCLSRERRLQTLDWDTEVNVLDEFVPDTLPQYQGLLQKVV